jgi:hypothetical protein
MSRTPAFDRKALAALLVKQHGVISREQAFHCGMSRPMVRYRCHEAGPWRVLLPGVYLSHTGTATDEQRGTAAVPGQIRQREVAGKSVPALAAGRDRPVIPISALPAR